jgi:hypothetical protein
VHPGGALLQRPAVHRAQDPLRASADRGGVRRPALGGGGTASLRHAVGTRRLPHAAARTRQAGVPGLAGGGRGGARRARGQPRRCGAPTSIRPFSFPSPRRRGSTAKSSSGR